MSTCWVAERWAGRPGEHASAVHAGIIGMIPAWTSSSTRASSSSRATASRCPPAVSADHGARGGRAADRIGYPVVVKAQVQVGGRGKAGGIKLAANARRGPHPRRATSSGMDIKGHIVQGRRGSSRRSDIAEEYYASFTLDRARQAAPRHAVGAGRRRDRAGRGREPRRDRQDPHRPGRRAHRGARAASGSRRPS